MCEHALREHNEHDLPTAGLGRPSAAALDARELTFKRCAVGIINRMAAGVDEVTAVGKFNRGGTVVAGGVVVLGVRVVSYAGKTDPDEQNDSS